MKSLRHIKKSFTLQQDQSDCGVACVLSIIRYYNGDEQLEKIRRLSGTDASGTSLLGLYQSANALGFKANAFEAEIENLEEIAEPCILHVINQGGLPHYVVLYGKPLKEGRSFILGDPSSGIRIIDAGELLKVWKSKALLQFAFSPEFISKPKRRADKWKWFWKLLQPDIDTLAVTIFLGIIITITGLGISIFSQKLIDKILPKGDVTNLIVGLSLLFGVLALGAVMSYLRATLLLKQGRDFKIRILSDFFNSILNLPKSFFDTRKTGEMITRLSDTDRIQRNLAYVTGTFFTDLILVAATSFFLINYSLAISLITFAFVPVIIFIVLKFSKPIKDLQREVMAYGAINQSNYIDNISGIAVIKADNRQTTFLGKTSEINTTFQQKILTLGKLANKFNLISDALGVVINLTLISVSCFLVLKHHIKVGEMIAVISLAGRLIPAISRISQINIQIQEANVAFDRMYDFTEITPEFTRSTDGPRPKIQFKKLSVENISFRFPGKRAIIKDLTFEINRGEIVAFLGESGCGKTTLMQIIQKFYKADSGSIRVNDQPLELLDTPEWRDCIAVVPQETKIFNGTILYNITLVESGENLEEVIDFCNGLGLDDFFRSMPQAYLTLVGEEGLNLSGGQKQIVALIRALIRRPQFLLLDEATAAMDRNTEGLILNILTKRMGDLTIMLITHKIQTAQIADRIYIVKSGAIEDYDQPRDLLKRDNLFSQLVSDIVAFTSGKEAQ